MLMVVVLAMLMVLVLGMALTAFAFGEVAFSEAGVTRPTGTRGLNAKAIKSHCPSSSSHPIRVTTPETLAIADVVRQTQPALEVQRILDLSRSNARRIQGLTQEQIAKERIVCPLLSREGDCIAYDARPLSCRRCGLNAEQGRDECALDLTELEHGIGRGLRTAGLDGNQYELNEALTVVLENRDAASRWAKGENVLAG
ncbi:MAG: hypothetical protein DWH81_08210 [Planctomycetota bacterium]|nr:MAG: hypothetical protein DWH81_08210 [Planctomycetota bacterium]